MRGDDLGGKNDGDGERLACERRCIWMARGLSFGSDSEVVRERGTIGSEEEEEEREAG